VIIEKYGDDTLMLLMIFMITAVVKKRGAFIDIRIFTPDFILDFN
jgi:hypothetical protein